MHPPGQGLWGSAGAVSRVPYRGRSPSRVLPYVPASHAEPGAPHAVPGVSCGVGWGVDGVPGAGRPVQRPRPASPVHRASTGPSRVGARYGRRDAVRRAPGTVDRSSCTPEVRPDIPHHDPARHGLHDVASSAIVWMPIMPMDIMPGNGARPNRSTRP